VLEFYLLVDCGDVVFEVECVYCDFLVVVFCFDEVGVVGGGFVEEYFVEF